MYKPDAFRSRFFFFPPSSLSAILDSLKNVPYHSHDVCKKNNHYTSLNKKKNNVTQPDQEALVLIEIKDKRNQSIYLYMNFSTYPERFLIDETS